MLPYRDNRLTRFVLIVFFILVGVYGYAKAQGLLLGPRITVPEEPSIVHEQLVLIRGTAAHIAEISLNGAQIPVTEDGSFSQPYLLAPGYNRIILDARDKYGKTTQRVIEILYDTSDVSSMPAETTASTTTSTSASVDTATSSQRVVPAQEMPGQDADNSR